MEKSWAGAFYHGFFRQIDEALFAVLYAEEDSRPNVAVNVLVGFEALPQLKERLDVDETICETTRFIFSV